MATPNYGYEKRQRELEKKRKKEDKARAKAERKANADAAGETRVLDDAAADTPGDVGADAHSGD